ncbi:T9SS type A sorting domain-containing protein [Chryseobacterium daeguense]|uniref:T9SS type A sorting domain-containing protein n=1 Tax=Chryseobacterium daeguense TaxID=412438 RepID=UPI0004144171|nr:T9SS type A sorting domain-containing protein [Chryseobacterium daeguense]
MTISNEVLSTNDVVSPSKSSVKYYPNPVKNTLNYVSKGKVDEINIFDSNGRKVQTKKVNSEQGSIDISGLNNGIYIISGKTDSGTGTFKMIKN